MWEKIIRNSVGIRPGHLFTLLCDGLTLQIVLSLCILVRSMWGNIDYTLYFWMSILLCSGPIFALVLGSCEEPVPPPHKEVKKLFLSVSLAYLVILVVFFMTQVSVEYSRIIMVFAWGISVVAVPMVRGFVRRRLCRKMWWGTPVVFLQSREEVADLWQELLDYPERGLRPVECLNVNAAEDCWKERIKYLQEQYVTPMFVWCSDSGKKVDETPFFEEIALHCKKILVVPLKVRKLKKFWLAPRVLGSSTAFLVKQNLTDVRRLRVKRCMDIFIAVLALIGLAPLFIFLVLWIRSSSEGPAFYSQRRIGQGGKHIRIFKFRSMVQNADEVLEKYLQENALYREEWGKDQKLRHDPRITKVGHFLRKTSLDELPQLFNVLMGNMTLVGPRPIVDSEIKRYGDVYLEYREVKPGITGLWQISGRNNTTYEQRVSYDRYYVTNWSVWMDLWILMRTIPVALRGHGAF